MQEAQTGRRGYRGRSALHWASRNGQLEVVKWLVENGFPKDVRNVDGTTPFHFACWQAQLEVCKALADQSTGPCDVNACNEYGCNAALWSTQGIGGADFCAELKALGVDFRSVNRNAHTCLHKAAQRGASDVVEWLLEEVLEVSPLLKGNRDQEPEQEQEPKAKPEADPAADPAADPEPGADWRSQLDRFFARDVDGHAPAELAELEGHHEISQRISRAAEALGVYDALDKGKAGEPSQATQLTKRRD
mmetsp:Transcript_6497/g.25152  ORF Transcript_6497/g.25152 Transcript_6497/m.25152 type:complete len:248 (+) Transcript_6497:1032-1775(+)